MAKLISGILLLLSLAGTSLFASDNEEYAQTAGSSHERQDIEELRDELRQILPELTVKHTKNKYISWPALTLELLAKHPKFACFSASELRAYWYKLASKAFTPELTSEDVDILVKRMVDFYLEKEVIKFPWPLWLGDFKSFSSTLALKNAVRKIKFAHKLKMAIWEAFYERGKSLLDASKVIYEVISSIRIGWRKISEAQMLPFKDAANEWPTFKELVLQMGKNPSMPQLQEQEIEQIECELRKKDVKFSTIAMKFRKLVVESSTSVSLVDILLYGYWQARREEAQKQQDTPQCSAAKRIAAASQAPESSALLAGSNLLLDLDIYDVDEAWLARVLQ